MTYIFQHAINQTEDELERMVVSEMEKMLHGPQYSQGMCILLS